MTAEAAAPTDGQEPVQAATDTPTEQAATEASIGAEVVQFRPRQSLNAKISYAQHLAQSGLLPAQYRQKPANVLWAAEYGEMLGLAPMAAITGIHVIDGKPTASAALISALVRRAGHKLRVTGNDQRATVQIIRKDDPDFVFESTWTIDRARQAGLVNKDVWKKYPAAMLKARAITEAARDACEEALSGMHYTPEELGADNLDEEGMPIGATTVEVGQPIPNLPPQRDWDAEIAALAEDAERLRALWYEAKGAGRGDVQQKINAAVAALQAKQTPPAEKQQPAETPAAAPAPAADSAPAEEVEEVEAELVEEPLPAPKGTADIPTLVDAVVHAGQVGTIAGARDLVKQRGGKLGFTDIRGLLRGQHDGVPAELQLEPGSKVTLLEFLNKAAAYVEREGYSIANGAAVAAQQAQEAAA